MAISSLIVEAVPESTERVAEQIAAIEGASVEGTDPELGKIVVVL